MSKHLHDHGRRDTRFQELRTGGVSETVNTDSLRIDLRRTNTGLETMEEFVTTPAPSLPGSAFGEDRVLFFSLPAL